jgi:hypothetical protein
MQLTVHDVAAPSAMDAARRTRMGRLKMLLVLLICAAPVVASYFTFYVIKPQGSTNYGSLITPPRALPALALRTLDGQSLAASSLKGQWLLVVVAPSACPGACEALLFQQRQLREMLGRERDRMDKVWLITDTGAPTPTLRAALDAAPATTMLRADAVAVSQWLAPEAGRALEDHLYLVDPLGQWMMRMPAHAEPGRVKRDLERLLRAAKSWDRPGRP